MKTPQAAALNVERVSHSFGKTRALDDVSLSICSGGFTALLGVNGAGKTTLISLITRLYDNISGKIEIGGYDVRRNAGPALAGLGVVFQSRSLDVGLTVRQNMRYHAALHGIGKSEARRRGDLVLDRVGLIGQADMKVAALSGGQTRRAEIARALLHNPRLLLLDEATVGLDIQSRRDVVSTVRGLVREEGVAVLWATHLFDEIDPQDDVVVLHRGRVLARDSSAALAQGTNLSDAFLALTGAEPVDVLA